MDHGNAPTKIKRKANKAIIAESFAKKAKTLKAPSGLVNLASVTPTPQLSAKCQHALRRKITRNDLPDGICQQFYDSYIPYAIRLAGYKEAWYNPTYNDAYHSWLAVLVTSEEGYGQPSEDHIFVAEKLINIHISQICNKTKEVAVKALDILLRNENMKTIEKADYVKWLQGEGLYDNAPPFYYKTIEDDGKKKICPATPLTK
ncbi:hypothetical protein BDN71DRAFT_1505262 [Pleurotus eryngii]|uniref:Uncharacterized protein n=1 Tax=Pleurotus eryngii TaxID=5323 RepID=A0A9P5ZZ96_PLEER|nr:hypothetical protein BDN71DRAFT_1505262 [Pleurotus eryngii]